jgi:hypothetical protein
MWKEKKKTEVIIETHQYRIVGTVHLDHESRLLDMLNLESQHFIAVTTASIYSRNEGKLLYNSNFLGLNKDHVVSMAESEGSV